MTSENIGEKDDLELNAEDADEVVGGTKKKKKAATHKSPAHTAQAPAPTLGAPMSQADMERYDQDRDRPQPRPVYGTGGTSQDGAG